MVTSVLYKSETFTEIFCFRIIIICIYECFLFQILKKKHLVVYELVDLLVYELVDLLVYELIDLLV